MSGMFRFTFFFLKNFMFSYVNFIIKDDAVYR
jgi:hypothetical protein